MKKILLNALVVLGVIVVGSQAFANCAFGGRVFVEGNPGQGIEGATVSWTGPNSGSVSTDVNGNYNAVVNDVGTYSVTYSKAGFTSKNTSQIFSSHEIRTGVDLALSSSGGSTGGINVFVQDNNNAPMNAVPVSVDNVSKGTTDGTGHLIVPNMSVGSHSVSIQVTGGATVAPGNPQNVTVAVSSNIPANFTVTPPATGGIAVRVQNNANTGIDGIQVFVDGQAKGPTAGGGNLIVTGLSVGSHTVMIQGYEAGATVTPGVSQNVTVAINSNIPATFTVTPPAASTGGIDVFVKDDANNPKSAIPVSVDGVFKGNTDGSGHFIVLNMTVGGHNVSIQVADGATVSPINPQNVTVAISSNIPANFIVTPAPSTGTIRVSVKNPSNQGLAGASVRVDAGSPMTTDGSGVALFAGLTTGSHTVTIISPPSGYNMPGTATQNATVNADQMTNVDFSVTESVTTGGINVFVQDNTNNPMNAIPVSVDNVFKGNTDNTGHLIVPNMSVGGHNVSIQVANGATVAPSNPQNVTVAISSNIPANFIVTPAVVAPSTGTIQVNVKNLANQGVANASVRVDSGNPVVTDGAGVATFPGLSTGAHTVTFVNPPSGYNMPSTVVQNVTVNANQVTPVDFVVTESVTTGGIEVHVENNVGAPMMVPVMIDGQSKGNTDGSTGNLRITGLAVRGYNVSIQIEGGATVASPGNPRTVTVALGSNITANFVVTPAPSVGTISGRVFNQHTNAGLNGINVAIDGTGHSAVTASGGYFSMAQVLYGTYTLRIATASNFNVPVTRPNVILNSPALINQDIPMAPLGDVNDSGNFGGIRVLVKTNANIPIPIPNVPVTVDGQFKGNTSDTGELIVVSLAVGPRNVSIQLAEAGASVASPGNPRAVTVAFGSNILAEFIVSPPVPTAGTLLVRVKDGSNSGIPSVPIYINGQSRGVTSSNGELTISNVPAGSYPVAIQTPGSEIVSPSNPQNASVVGGQITTVNFTVTPPAPTTGNIDGYIKGPNAAAIPSAVVVIDGHQVVTDGSGYYLVSGLSVGPKAISVSVPGGAYNNGSGNATVAVGVTTRATEIVLATALVVQTTGNVDGYVKGPNNVPVPNATVVIGGQQSVTDSSGRYQINNLSVNAYAITVTPPNGANLSDGSGNVTVAVGAMTRAAEIVLTFTGSVPVNTATNGHVDGFVRGPNGGPIPNATVMIGDRQTVTDQAGYYQMTGLPISAYPITVNAPPNSGMNNGSGQVTVVGGLVTRAADIVLTATVGAATGSVSGRVFNQINHSQGIGGATVRLTRPDLSTQDVTTVGDGGYFFSGLTSGAFQLQVTSASGYTASGLVSIAMSSGEQKTNVGIGLMASGPNVVTDSNTAGISGRVFKQTDASVGISGATVRLIKYDGSTQDATTGGSGNYQFTGLSAGAYQVQVVVAANYEVPAPLAPVYASVSIGQQLSGMDFGLAAIGGNVVTDPGNGKIGGRVFNQSNPSQGISGALVRLTKFDGTSVEVTTASDGFYRFTNLFAGNYSVQVLVASGYGAPAPFTPLSVALGLSQERIDIGIGLAGAQAQQLGTAPLNVQVYANGNSAQPVANVAIMIDGNFSGNTNAQGQLSATVTVTLHHVAVGVLPTGYTYGGANPQPFTAAIGGSTVLFSVTPPVIGGGTTSATNGQMQIQVYNTQPSQPLAGVQLFESATSRFWSTNAQGRVLGIALPAGSYQVGLAVPPGYMYSGQNPQTVVVAGGTMTSVTFALTPGQNAGLPQGSGSGSISGQILYAGGLRERLHVVALNQAFEGGTRLAESILTPGTYPATYLLNNVSAGIPVYLFAYMEKNGMTAAKGWFGAPTSLSLTDGGIGTANVDLGGVPTQIGLFPNAGGPGVTVNVNGYGFAASETITKVRWRWLGGMIDLATLPTMPQVDAFGNFQFSFIVPSNVVQGSFYDVVVYTASQPQGIVGNFTANAGGGFTTTGGGNLTDQQMFTETPAEAEITNVVVNQFLVLDPNNLASKLEAQPFTVNVTVTTPGYVIFELDLKDATGKEYFRGTSIRLPVPAMGVFPLSTKPGFYTSVTSDVATTRLPAGIYTFTAKVTSGNRQSTRSINIQVFSEQQLNTTNVVQPPTLNNPPDGATVQSGLPNFVWGPVSGANQYDIYVGLNQDPTQDPYWVGRFQHPNTQAVYPIEGRALQPGGRYYWMVRSLRRDQTDQLVPIGGTDGRSRVAKFTVGAGGSGPSRISVIFPKGEVDRQQIMFMWSPIPSAFGYRVFVSKDPGMGTAMWRGESQSTNLMYPMDAPTFEERTQYFWGVIGLGSDQQPLGSSVTSGASGGGWQNYSVASDIFSFQLKAAALNYQSAQLIAPRGEIVKPTGPLMFMWSPVVGVAQYLVVVSDDPTASKALFKGAVPSSNFMYPPDAPPLKEGVTYYWKVQLADANGRPIANAPSSDAASFSFKAGGAPVQQQFNLGLISPRGETDRAQLMLMWTPVQNASQYRVIVSQDANLGRPLWSDTTQASNLMYPQDAPILVERTPYYWGVVALDQSQNPIGAPQGTGRGWPPSGLKSEVGSFSLRSLMLGAGPTPGTTPGISQPGVIPIAASPYDVNNDGKVDRKDFEMMRAMKEGQLRGFFNDARVARRDGEILRKFFDQKIDDVTGDGMVDEKDAVALKEVGDRVMALGPVMGGATPGVGQPGNPPIVGTPQPREFQPGGMTMPNVGNSGPNLGGTPSVGGMPIVGDNKFIPEDINADGKIDAKDFDMMRASNEGRLREVIKTGKGDIKDLTILKVFFDNKGNDVNADGKLDEKDVQMLRGAMDRMAMLGGEVDRKNVAIPSEGDGRRPPVQMVGMRDVAQMLSQFIDRQSLELIKDYDLINIRWEPMPTPEQLADLMEQLRKGEAQVSDVKVEDR